MNFMTKERKQNLSIAILILALVIVLGTCGCSSCNKQSRLDKITLEKVVVIDRNTHKSGALYLYQYKVKRIEKGVVDMIYDERLLEKGDTIYHKFPN